MKKVFAVLLCALLGITLAMPAFASEGGSFTVTNPYEDVVWSGTGQWGAYKANLHTHTTFSDGTESLKAMVEEYYAKGYDVIANADHGVVSTSWDKRPMTVFPLDVPNWGKSHEVLSGARLKEINDGEGRDGRGMIQVPKGIELNAATVYKSHSVGLFGGWGQAWLGLSSDYRTPLAGTQSCGGISFIAHPGDWLKSEFDRAVAENPANINFFADILRDYDSCLGMEIYNGSDGPTRHDRVLWDQLLMRMMPEGATVWGFAVDDSHNLGDIGRTATIHFMPANTADNVRRSLESGTFLAASRRDRIRLPDFVGDGNVAFPSVTNIEVANETITLTTTDTETVEWIADGVVIATGGSINLREYADVITCYVRAQLIGPGGITATQAFGVDKGDGYRHPDDALKGWDRIKWYFNMYLTKNVFGWLVENVQKLFN
ncbi:MAG: hypothetical protein FWF05_07785 [Oscillospiraceae bacterium]|nr:hypothetical protein [Oscillospiraceae bacterium]